MPTPPKLDPIAPVAGCARPGRIAVIYDGDCSMCRVSAEAVRMFDNSNAIDLIDLHDPDTRTQFPELTIEALMQELYVVDDRGQLWRGARAVNEVLRHQHGLRGWLAYLWYIPGYAWLADWQYKRIALNRYGRGPGGIPRDCKGAPIQPPVTPGA
jgi:predicted DCC family thiol-disulfide oxidoreductase YuxK